uniref:Protein kinase domain-containing protein n=1 Tax=Globisporangium ultimum (strain ATCC 200006 / CBS 805.95 / DAOM BR144) TaxID=431595 RepID=K3WSS3_GLOUD
MLFVALGEAVDVGDSENADDNDNDDDSSGSADACSDLTTLAESTSTSLFALLKGTTGLSAVVVSANSCKRKTVNGEAIEDDNGEKVSVLDVRGQGIQRVIGIPPSVETLYLHNNSLVSIESFTFPSSIRTLDLSANFFLSLDSMTFPATLTTLDLSDNDILSVANVTFPETITMLNLAGCNLATLENFSFPRSVESLNFSGNSITRIAGVIFPESLDRLVIKPGYIAASALSTATAFAAATAPTTVSTTATTSTTAASTVTADALSTQSNIVFEPQPQGLEEFEVRQADFDRFGNLSLFDVSATSTLKCSDPLAKPRYVNSTMLCVLSDNDFIAKYASVAEEAAITDGTILVRSNETHAVTERPLLHETWHQNRSWFLAGSATVMGGFVLVLGVCGCIHVFCRRAYNLGQEIRREQLEKSMRKSAAIIRQQMDKETDALLSSDSSAEKPLESTEAEPSVNRTVTTQSLAEQLEQFLIASSAITSIAPLASQATSEGEIVRGSGANTPGFAYYTAIFKSQQVVLKHLSCRDKNVSEVKRVASLRCFLQEIHLNTMVSHPQIVTFLGYFNDELPSTTLSAEDLSAGNDSDESLTLVTECMGKGSLDAFIQKERELAREEMKLQQAGFGRENSIVDETGRPDHWTWQYDSASYKSKLSIAVDIARGLAYLHSFSPSLFHGNLSSRKVLLDESWNVKLNDLSCCSALWRWSERQQEQGKQASLNKSTSTVSEAAEEEVRLDMTVWTAPEVIDGQQYTTKADMYSFGILLSQLDTYEFPVDALHRVDSEVAILGSTRGEVIPVVGGRSPVPLRILTMNCISFQPEDRPSAQEALDELLSIQADLRDESTCSEDTGWQV